MSVDRLRVARSRTVHWVRVASCALACVSACASAKRSDAPAQEPAAARAPSKYDARPSKTKEAPPGAPPAAGSAEDSAAPRSEAAGAMPPPAAAQPSPPVAPAELSREYTRPAPGAGDPHSPVASARLRLSEARRELDIATSERDCARACRALESMERAMHQVCDLARSPEERRECASAGDQVEKARTKVQSACGGCAGKTR